MKMPVVEMPKREAEPLGKEISIDVGKFKDVKGYKVGDEICLKLECVVVGQHMHDIGGKKEHMYDVKITELEVEEEDEEEEEEE